MKESRLRKFAVTDKPVKMPSAEIDVLLTSTIAELLAAYIDVHSLIRLRSASKSFHQVAKKVLRISRYASVGDLVKPKVTKSSWWFRSASSSNSVEPSKLPHFDQIGTGLVPRWRSAFCWLSLNAPNLELIDHAIPDPLVMETFIGLPELLDRFTSIRSLSLLCQLALGKLKLQKTNEGEGPQQFIRPSWSDMTSAIPTSHLAKITEIEAQALTWAEPVGESSPLALPRGRKTTCHIRSSELRTLCESGVDRLLSIVGGSAISEVTVTDDESLSPGSNINAVLRSISSSPLKVQSLRILPMVRFENKYLDGLRFLTQLNVGFLRKSVGEFIYGASDQFQPFEFKMASAIEAISRMKHLKSLGIYYAWISEEIVGSLAKLSELEHLGLQFESYLPEMSLKGLNALKKLKSLHLMPVSAPLRVSTWYHGGIVKVTMGRLPEELIIGHHSFLNETTTPLELKDPKRLFNSQILLDVDLKIMQDLRSLLLLGDKSLLPSAETKDNPSNALTSVLKCSNRLERLIFSEDLPWDADINGVENIKELGFVDRELEKLTPFRTLHRVFKNASEKSTSAFRNLKHLNVYQENSSKLHGMERLKMNAVKDFLHQRKAVLTLRRPSEIDTPIEAS